MSINLPVLSEKISVSEGYDNLPSLFFSCILDTVSNVNANYLSGLKISVSVQVEYKLLCFNGGLSTAGPADGFLEHYSKFSLGRKIFYCVASVTSFTGS